MYAHAGGSPQALATLRAKGSGQLVYNADEFRWGGSFYRRVHDAVRRRTTCTPTRQAPARARQDGSGAKDGPIKLALDVRAGRAARQRPVGGRIQVALPAPTRSATTTTGRPTPTSAR